MQKIALEKDPQHAIDALWWNPWLSYQKYINDCMEMTLAPYTSPALWDKEQWFATHAQGKMHEVMANLFNNISTYWPMHGSNHIHVSILERKNSFQLKAILPLNIKAENVELLTEDKAVTIKCKSQNKHSKTQGKAGQQLLSRTVALPISADIEKATTSFAKGHLTILIPKKSAMFCEDTV